MASTGTVGTAAYGMAALAGLTTLSDQKTANQAIALQVSQESEMSIYRLGMSQQEIKEIDRELSRALNQTEIQSMKDEAFAKAYTAQSGLSGNTAEDVQSEASVNKALTQADQVAQAKAGQRGQLREMFGEKLRFSQRSELLLNELQTPASAGLQSAANTMSGFQTGLGFFDSTSVENFLKD